MTIINTNKKEIKSDKKNINIFKNMPDFELFGFVVTVGMFCGEIFEGE